jgi:hypothetical protein
LSSLGGEDGVTAEYDVDGLRGVLEVATPQLVLLVIVCLVLALLLLFIFEHWGFEGLAEIEALPCRMLSLRVPWALLVQDLFKFLLRVSRLLAMWGTVDNRDEIIWLPLP